MAFTPVYPAPFQSGIRMHSGEALNKQLASPVVSSQDGLAVTGTTRATALQLLTMLNRFATVGASAQAILPPAMAGTRCLVMSTSGQSNLTVIGYSSADTIDGNATATLTAANRGAWFYCIARGVWVSELMGAASS